MVTNLKPTVTAFSIVLFNSIAPVALAASSTEAAGTEFFERRIRPVLVENCYLCHSSESKPLQGNLRLDTPEGMLKGGNRGPAVVPGALDESLLIKAITHADPQLKMPPASKLGDQQIADFVAWVRMGAPHPSSDELSAAAPGQAIDFEKGRRFWFFQGIQASSIPRVKTPEWARTPIDHFILAKLEEKGLRPAPPADRRTWIRRVTFDLTGLPPTPAETQTFVEDESAEACQKVVDRLLASPHYGEQWARHWLDLVRYAESNGHEFDEVKLDAWRYRDYVIRAFNQDVPYDQFIKEHIAGDLIPEKRISRDSSYWESPLGTTFYWFGEVLNLATDSVKSRADEVDNQIDVVSKAFLGLTVACARCHDHKFDPVPTSDYYALAGVMHSTRMNETIVDAPSRSREIVSIHQQISDTNQQIIRLLRSAESRAVDRLQDYLVRAALFLFTSDAERAALGRVVEPGELEDNLLRDWICYLEEAVSRPDHVFNPFVTLADRLLRRILSGPTRRDDNVHDLPPVSSPVASVLLDHERRGDIVYEDFEKLSYEGWRAAGQAFGTSPAWELAPNQFLRGYQGQGLASSFGKGSDRLVGSLTSEKFKMPKRYLHVRMAGSREERARERAKLRFSVVVDGYKSRYLLPAGNGVLEWKTAYLKPEIGRICYFEIIDRSSEGHIIIDKIVLSDSKEPPSLAKPNRYARTMWSEADLSSLESLAESYQGMFRSVLRQSTGLDRDTRWLRSALNPGGGLEDLSAFLTDDELGRFSELQSRRAALQARVPESVFAMVAGDDKPHNIRIHIRGDHKNLGDEVPRRYLQILAGQDQPPIGQGSGRLTLAERLASPTHPQTARVMVNRVWKHYFGHGIVRSPDNFGRMGDPPTHPQLLDFLAKHFIEKGWSIKALHRLLTLSSTYRMSSQVEPRAAKTDPGNRFLHHMPVRRLEAESIRDSVLAVAGSLDRQMFGPSVPPHVTEYQGGRGKPESGPLDGDGRRSIYVQVRRNFMTPMFLVFDYPLPISSMGKRNVSTVPSQALMMMNSEFVAGQARKWADRVTSGHEDRRERVEQMYLTAFGRPPEDWEFSEVLGFVESQESHYESLVQSETEATEQRVWTDLGHVLLNSAEFLYVR